MLKTRIDGLSSVPPATLAVRNNWEEFNATTHIVRLAGDAEGTGFILDTQRRQRRQSYRKQTFK
jgi:hypothetical protein